MIGVQDPFLCGNLTKVVKVCINFLVLDFTNNSGTCESIWLRNYGNVDEHVR